jgi:predicted NUDIX family NTP pyrophosphohydrolase
VDPEALESNTFEMEWPPNSGTTHRFPELDRAAYFRLVGRPTDGWVSGGQRVSANNLSSGQ